MNDEPERHSRAIEVDLITDPAERTRQEARNGLRQFDEVVEQIEYSLQPERQPFRLRPSVVRLGYRLPGTNTIPQQIAANKQPYYEALEAADKSWSPQGIDLSRMEALLKACLANQLLSVLDEAKTGAKMQHGL